MKKCHFLSGPFVENAFFLFSFLWMSKRRTRDKSTKQTKQTKRTNDTNNKLQKSTVSPGISKCSGGGSTRAECSFVEGAGSEPVWEGAWASEDKAIDIGIRAIDLVGPGSVVADSEE
mmetsp:Transcript_30133/g.77807  ORF Transcript_30133/g.77807 Transcript_30133/m.77807 type:complete len:117 (+) Transcript_30133:4353-4703(+)